MKAKKKMYQCISALNGYAGTSEAPHSLNADSKNYRWCREECKCRVPHVRGPNCITSGHLTRECTCIPMEVEDG